MTTTAKDWRTMEPGRELDALVAERVAGWKWVRTWRGERFLAPPTFVPDPLYQRDWLDGTETDEESRWWLRDTKSGADLDVVPHFSTDVAIALSLGPALRARPEDGWQFNLHLVEYAYARTYAYFGTEPDSVDWQEGNGAHATPLAICRAALAATEAR